MKIYLVAFALLASSSLFAQIPDCKKLSEELAAKTELSEQKLKGLNSLIGPFGDPTVPLEVIFQIDVQTEPQVAQRVKALSALATKEDIAKSKEFADLKKCVAMSVETEKLLLLRLEINTKKIQFFKLDFAKRQELVSAYETSRRSKQTRNELDLQIEAAANAILSNDQQSEASPQNQDDVAASLALLRGTSNENEKSYLAFLAFFKLKKERLDELSRDFKAHLSLGDTTQTETRLAAVAKVWRELVDEL